MGPNDNPAVQNPPDAPAFGKPIGLAVPPADLQATPRVPGDLKRSIVEEVPSVVVGVGGLLYLAETRAITSTALKLGVKYGIGHSPTAAFKLNVLGSFIGPANELLEFALSEIGGTGHHFAPERPIIDIDGLRRNALTVGSFLPGISEWASQANARILAEDLRPEVERFKRNVQAIDRSTTTDQNFFSQPARVVAYANLLIESGADREAIVPIVNNFLRYVHYTEVAALQLTTPKEFFYATGAETRAGGGGGEGLDKDSLTGLVRQIAATDRDVC